MGKMGKHNITRSVLIGFVFFGLIMAFLAGLFFGTRNKFEEVSDYQAQLYPTPTLAPLDAGVLTALVNQWRIDNGFKPFRVSAATCSIAETRLGRVVLDFDHDGFTEATDDYARANHLPASKWGENLATVEISELETLNDWLNSPKHKENLVLDVDYMCIKTTDYTVVQIFGTQ